MYLEWVKYAVAVVTIAAIGWIVYVYYFDDAPRDGGPCTRDNDCPGEICLRDVNGRHCTRECATDGECDEGWRCLDSVQRRGLHCVRPLEN